MLRRSGKAEEIGYTALFLASDESSSAPYLGKERSHHMLSLLKKKDQLQEKKDELEAFFKRYL